MAVIVLGAGATRGASFVDALRKTGGCLPPLDTDFFTQLQRVANVKHQDVVNSTIKDAVALFGNNFDVTLETMFSTIEHTLRIMEATGKECKTKKSDYVNKRTNLIQALAAVLEESLTMKDKKSTPSPCDFHETLVKVLSTNDAIISLNYDCLMDYTLKEHGADKWNAAYGYCLPRPKGRSQTIGEEHWHDTTKTHTKATLRLLKLHGSMNFRKEGTLVKLKDRPYTKQHGNLRAEIIPPEWNKKCEGHFQKIWKHAAQEIHAAKTLVFIGYSFPAADLHTAALFRVSVKKLANVVVVNPDKMALHRTLEVIKKGLTEKTLCARSPIGDENKEPSTEISKDTDCSQTQRGTHR